MEAHYRDRQKDLLRDLIDQQLLVQRAKDQGVSVETDVIKRLDEVRKQNNLQSLDDLEKAVEGEGMSWEDYKAQIRNSLLTQEVIAKEMRGRIIIGDDEVKKFYEEHPKEFTRPEQVVLAEIFLSTTDKSPEETAVIEHKAQDYLNRLKKGEEFSEMAKRYSEGSTAKEGGGLGTFERGQLSKQLEDATFSLNKGGLTDVIQTKTGYEVLKVVDRFQAGLQPLDKVRREIENEIYMKKMQPTLREYLAQLREESYVTVKPGFTDSAAMAGASIIQEVSPTPDAPQKSGKRKLPKPKTGG
jgi:peptidyl-prolyl cis-trans isomerase SurA